MLLLAGSPQRRAAMRDTGEFCPPDPLALLTNVGPSDGAGGFGCLQARVAEALLLIGAHDLAVAYTEEHALRMVLRFDARVQIALVRGRALAARGDDAAAATAALESAAAAARQAGMVMEEARALQLMLDVGGGAGAAGEGGARLAAVLRRLKGTASEITGVFPDRDNVPTLDAEALFAAFGR